MKTLLRSAARSALLVSLLAVPAFAAPAPADRAADLLRRHGTVAIEQAGPHVAVGTFRIQVETKLGRPDLKLADGTWLYRGRAVEGSSAAGTLVVRFAGGRVSSLALATPAAVALLETGSARDLVATK